jgi:hypothetical protein
MHFVQPKNGSFMHVAFIRIIQAAVESIDFELRFNRKLPQTTSQFKTLRQCCASEEVSPDHFHVLDPR